MKTRRRVEGKEGERLRKREKKTRVKSGKNSKNFMRKYGNENVRRENFMRKKHVLLDAVVIFDCKTNCLF